MGSLNGQRRGGSRQGKTACLEETPSAELTGSCRLQLHPVENSAGYNSSQPAVNNAATVVELKDKAKAKSEEKRRVVAIQTETLCSPPNSSYLLTFYNHFCCTISVLRRYRILSDSTTLDSYHHPMASLNHLLSHFQN